MARASRGDSRRHRHTHQFHCMKGRGRRACPARATPLLAWRAEGFCVSCAILGIGGLVVLLLGLILVALLAGQVRYDGPGSALVMIVLVVAALLWIFAG